MYDQSLDIGCCLSQQGDLAIFGFESPAWRAKRVVLGKTKVEACSQCELLSIGGGKICYLGSTLTQIKFYDLLTQEAEVIELDDYFEDFDKVLPSMQVIPGMGIIVPMSKSGKVAFLGIENPERINKVDTKTGDFNQNYAMFKYVKSEDCDSNKKVVFTIRDVIQCDTEKSDQYILKVA